MEGKEAGEGWNVTFLAFGKEYQYLRGHVESGRERALQVAVENLRAMLLGKRR